MNAIEEVKKSLYESYKWLYEEAKEAAKAAINLNTIRRKAGKKTSGFLLNYATERYKEALKYKRSMEQYAN